MFEKPKNKCQEIRKTKFSFLLLLLDFCPWILNTRKNNFEYEFLRKS